MGAIARRTHLPQAKHATNRLKRKNKNDTNELGIPACAYFKYDVCSMGFEADEFEMDEFEMGEIKTNDFEMDDLTALRRAASS